MTIQQMRYIIALDNHRNFVKAAKSCFVAQPTLTLQVKKLENQLSISLFDRSSQPLKPTPVGEKFISKVREILDDIDQLGNWVLEERNDMEGKFKIGIIPTLAPYLLPLFSKAFLQKHPRTTLEIQEIQSESIIDKLHKNQLDVGLLATPLHEKNVKEIPLFYEPFLVFTDEPQKMMEKRDEITPADLRPEGLWLLEKGHCFRNQTLRLCEIQGGENKRNLIMQGGSIETLKPMIKKISGYTLIPELSYNELTDANSIIRFTEPQPVREISIAHRKNFTREKFINELRHTILENIPESFKKNNNYVKLEWR